MTTTAQALEAQDIEAIRAALADLPNIQRWFVVGPPWGKGDFVVAGHPDPHRGAYVCDTEDFDGDHPHSLEYAAYIEAVNPAVINRLLQVVEAGTEKLRCEQERTARLQAELSTLRASTALVQADQREENDRLRSECEALRKDAEIGARWKADSSLEKWFPITAENMKTLEKDAARYRWLRDVSTPPHNFYLSVPIEFDGVRYTPHEVDAAIDAALSNSTAPSGAKE